MTRARKEQISPSDTPYYHRIARCVRRAFLCGEDQFSGQSFEHHIVPMHGRLHLVGFEADGVSVFIHHIGHG